MEAMRKLIADEYKDEDEYIKAVFNGVVSMLSKRDSYGVAVHMFGKLHPYGPFYDIVRARKLGSAFAANMGVDVYTAELLAPAKLEPKDV